MIWCPNYCTVLTGMFGRCEFYHIHEGDGDDNTLYRYWNDHLVK